MKGISGYLDITPADFKEIYTRAYHQAVERIGRKVKALDIMTKEVVQVHPDTPLREVAELMSRMGVSGVPVVDNQGKPMGMISEKDFLKGLIGENSEHLNMMALVTFYFQSGKETILNLLNKTAGDIMSSPAITVHFESMLRDITEIFSVHHINRVPVVDPTGQVTGMVSRGDIINARWWGESSC
jgi:CBS domain-containing membrane protein